MKNFSIYSHDMTDPEADLVYMCTCNSEYMAQCIVDALKYKDRGGNEGIPGMYDYYIRESK